MDEVGELPLEVQPHLLRFLQDGSFLPLGETRPRVSNARIVAATNRDLERAVYGGVFREDLYHRLNVLAIRIPPLRERPEDIPLLFDHFLREAAQSEGLVPPGVDPDALARLLAYTWPGNVRELQNAARAALVASHPDTLLREKHLPSRMLSRSRAPAGGRTFAARVHEAERSILEEALREAGGNLSAAARTLGLSRQGFHAKLKRLGMK
jgi:two-component system response regulator HydG